MSSDMLLLKIPPADLGVETPMLLSAEPTLSNHRGSDSSIGTA